MTYLVPADFHAASIKWWCTGIPIENSDISDTNLTALIADASQRFDQYTDDHFEPETGSAISVTANSGTDTFTATAHGLGSGWTVRIGGTPPAPLATGTDYFVVNPTTNTFQLALTSGGAAVDLTTNGASVTVTSYTTVIFADSMGGYFVRLPKRMRALVQLETQDWNGQFTVESSSVYRWEAFTGEPRQIPEPDEIYLIPGWTLGKGWTMWPVGMQTVRLTGSFGWSACPDRVKRAVALMCWEIVQPKSDYMRMAESYSVDGALFTPPAPGFLSRIPEVNQLADYFSRSRLMVA